MLGNLNPKHIRFCLLGDIWQYLEVFLMIMIGICNWHLICRKKDADKHPIMQREITHPPPQKKRIVWLQMSRVQIQIKCQSWEILSFQMYLLRYSEIFYENGIVLSPIYCKFCVLYPSFEILNMVSILKIEKSYNKDIFNYIEPSNFPIFLDHRTF